MRRLFTGILIALLVAGCGPGVSETESHPASQSAGLSAAPPSPTPIQSAPKSMSAAPTPTPTGTVEEPILAVGGFAEVVTTDLVVRSAPGTGADSEIFGTIEHGSAHLVAGPVEADGYEWWLVAHEDFERLGGPPAGWVAAAGKDGPVWLAPTRPDCPPAPTAGEWFVPSIWVSCYTGVEMTLGGALGGCSDAISLIWASTCSLYPCPDEVAPDTCLAGFDLPTVTLHFDSVSAPARGRISVTGHFDDPNASACTAEGGPLGPMSVFDCRRHFVVTAYRLDG